VEVASQVNDKSVIARRPCEWSVHHASVARTRGVRTPPFPWHWGQEQRGIGRATQVQAWLRRGRDQRVACRDVTGGFRASAAPDKVFTTRLLRTLPHLGPVGRRDDNSHGAWNDARFKGHDAGDAAVNMRGDMVRIRFHQGVPTS
jgi:hypothetical protein